MYTFICQKSSIMFKKFDLNSIQKWYIININKKCFNLIHSDLLA
nr:MAG TPA: hypothetical protein [Caudoviricetes sp.]